MAEEMDLLAAHAAANPDKPAVIDDRPGETVRRQTFAELNRYANRIATASSHATSDHSTELYGAVRTASNSSP